MRTNQQTNIQMERRNEIRHMKLTKQQNRIARSKSLTTIWVIRKLSDCAQYKILNIHQLINFE